MAEALEERHFLEDWEHGVGFGAEKHDHVHVVSILLVPVHHQDKGGIVQGAVVMRNEGVVEEESDVSHGDDFGAAVLPLGHFGVLA